MTSFASAARAAGANGAFVFSTSALLRAWCIFAFAARLDHRKRYAAAFLVHAHNPNLDDVAHGHHFVRVADEFVGQLADVDQPAVVHADIHKRAEIHHVEDRARQFHALGKIFEFEYALLEDRVGKIFARVAAGTGQLRQNVFQQQLAHCKLFGGRGHVNGFDALGQDFGPFAAADVFQAAFDPRQNAIGHGVAFRMDPGRVQRLIAAGDLEETGRLHESRVAEAGHLFQLQAVFEGAVLQAMFVNPAGGQLVQARHITQQGRAGRVDVHAHVVHARFDHLVQRGPQVFGLDVVLIHAHADAGRVDLDQFAQGILQPAADGNRAP